MERLDVYLFAKGLARSRSSAADLIKRGKVRVNGTMAAKASMDIRPTDAVTIDEGAIFASRAGEKLAHALKAFAVDPTGLTVIDIGSSTGGFTDCLLQAGAAKVIAVDVGTDQLAANLRIDPRVELHENTDIRKFALAEPIDMAVIDVSFISLEHILPLVPAFLKKGAQAIALVKPQFEVGKEVADLHKGVITDEKEQSAALDRVKAFAKAAKLKVMGETVSPLQGEKGNKEFLLFLTRS